MWAWIANSAVALHLAVPAVAANATVALCGVVSTIAANGAKCLIVIRVQFVICTKVGVTAFFTGCSGHLVQ